MALLIVNLDKQIGNAQMWRDNFAEQLPDLDIRIFPEVNDLDAIEYLAFIRPDFDAIPPLPNTPSPAPMPNFPITDIPGANSGGPNNGDGSFSNDDAALDPDAYFATDPPQLWCGPDGGAPDAAVPTGTGARHGEQFPLQAARAA